MEQPKNEPTTIDAYIALYPTVVQEKLTQIRTTIQTASPQVVFLLLKQN